MAKIPNLHCICNTNNSAISLKNGESLDTLAQLRTNDNFEVSARTNIQDKKRLLKRARRKYFTNGLVIGLAQASEKSETSLLEKSYWNSYHCSSVLQQKASGKIIGKYCKCRWCMVCNAIRTAVSIHQYSPIISSWKDLYFVTLTQKTVLLEDLSEQLNTMQNIFRTICENNRKKRKRGTTTTKLVGIRKLECTYNFKSNHYHPHYHILMDSKEGAEELRNQWLVRNPTAKSIAQDIRQADNQSMMELFKYMTKVVSKASNGSQRKIYYNALDNIFTALRGRRTLQPFGFKIPGGKTQIKDVDNSEVIAILKWYDNMTDWIDTETGEQLTEYKPSEGMAELLK